MRVALLGPISITNSAGLPVEIRGAKVLSVLTALLFQQRVSDEAMTAYLWGERPPATAKAQVYTYVSRLRAVLGEAPAIDRQGDSYHLDRSDVWFDAAEFTALARQGHRELAAGELDRAEQTLTGALGLWRGCILTEVTPELRDILLPSLDHTRLSVAEDLGAAILGLGKHQSYLPSLERLVRENPTHEPLSAQLMLALHRSGRRAEALDAFHRLEAGLRDELGLDPSREVMDLHVALLRGEEPGWRPARPSPVSHDASVPGPPPAPAAATVVLDPPPVVASPLPLPPPVAGAELDGPDLRALAARVDHLRSAHPRQVPTVSVTGMPGLGKSTLAVAVARAWPLDGPRVLASLADEEHRPIPPHRVMTDILSVLRQPTDVCGSIERCYQEALADRPVVLVLEDAVDAEQVDPLLAINPRSLVVVTGHRMVTPPESSVRIHRKPLNRQQSKAFLLRLLGPKYRDMIDGPAFARIIGVCAGIPALLRAVATRIPDPSMSPGRLWAHLVDDQLRGLEFDKVGGLPVQLAREQVATLTPLERTLLGVALQLPCPFSVRALKDVLGWRAGSTRVALEGLEELGLVGRAHCADGGPGWSVSWLLRAVQPLA